MFCWSHIFSETNFHGKYLVGLRFQRNMIFEAKYISELIKFEQDIKFFVLIPKCIQFRVNTFQIKYVS